MDDLYATLKYKFISDFKINLWNIYFDDRHVFLLYHKVRNKFLMAFFFEFF